MMKMIRCDRQVRFRTRRMALLCSAGLLAGLLLWTPLPVNRTLPDSTRVALLESNYLHSVRGADIPWYLRSGQWRADIRSLAAVWSYITGVEIAEQTNSAPQKDGSV